MLWAKVRSGIVYYPRESDYDGPDLMHLTATAICVGPEDLYRRLHQVATGKLVHKPGQPAVCLPEDPEV